jgi:hypothetical protein
MIVCCSHDQSREFIVTEGVLIEVNVANLGNWRLPFTKPEYRFKRSQNLAQLTF